VEKAVSFLIQDEQERFFSPPWCPVCLLARCTSGSVDGMLAPWVQHPGRQLGACPTGSNLRWKIRISTGFDPAAVKIPKRFTEVTTWKGKVDGII